MTYLDWIVLSITQIAIVVYGTWKSRKNKNIQSYILGNREMNWGLVGISIIATQASAITFLSTPGQAFGDGMRFIQFYIGMPIAMIILCIVAVPRYYTLKIYTAYEFLEHRFSLRMRFLTSSLFLIQRSMAAGISIYAPSIILSKVLGWSTSTLTLITGSIVIIYTVSGGAKAISQTQKIQMGIVLLGMIIATYYLINLLPVDISFSDSLKIAGKMDKLTTLDFKMDWNNRYNFWSGMLGGVFLFLSYFGTDQSQVQRYLSAKSIKESRMGLLMNGILKVPMQFFILFIGVLLFVFYQFHPRPIYFNSSEKDEAYKNESIKKEISSIEKQHDSYQIEKEQLIRKMLSSKDEVEIYQKKIIDIEEKSHKLRNKAGMTIKQSLDPEFDDEELIIKQERDYVFITFVVEYLPKGIIGLIISMILAAAMSSASAELGALGATSFNDIYKRMIDPKNTPKKDLLINRLLTMGWGIVAIIFAQYADRLENLIQAVNILGSLVYGTILGVFLVGFFTKKINSFSVFYAAILSELIILTIHFSGAIDSYLWYNVIGCLCVILFSSILHIFNTIYKKRKY